MNKKLQDLFNLPSDDEDNQSDELTNSENDENNDDELSIIPIEALSTIEKIDAALPAIRGLESSDKEMDEIADLSKDSFNNLMDYGFQIDPRFSSEIFSVAATMLGHSLSAREAKINKKLKMIDLRLKQAELERKLRAADAKETPAETPLGVATQIDRNDLIKTLQTQILNNAKSASSDK
jgi:hypothetical protein